MVHAGQVVARMDTRDLEASLRQAEAQIDQAEHSIAAARAELDQATSQVMLTAQELQRARSLLPKGFQTQEVVDQRQSQFNVARAAAHCGAGAYRRGHRGPRRRDPQRGADPRQHCRRHAGGAQGRSDPVPAGQHRRGTRRRWPCVRDARHGLRLHGHLPADRGGGTGRAWRRCAHRARRAAGRADPGEGRVRGQPKPVHPEDGRDQDPSATG